MLSSMAWRWQLSWWSANLVRSFTSPSSSRSVTFFFSCIAERARSIVGQLLETWNELVLIECRIFTRPSQKNKPTQTKTQHNPPHQQKPTLKVQWNFAKRCETKVKRLAPLSPSCDLFHHVVILHATRVIFRYHVYVCLSLLRRVSHIRQESTSLELVSALFGLPPLCTMFHKCLYLSTSNFLLAPENL